MHSSCMHTSSSRYFNNYRLIVAIGRPIFQLPFCFMWPLFTYAFSYVLCVCNGNCQQRPHPPHTRSTQNLSTLDHRVRGACHNIQKKNTGKTQINTTVDWATTITQPEIIVIARHHNDDDDRRHHYYRTS